MILIGVLFIDLDDSKCVGMIVGPGTSHVQKSQSCCVVQSLMAIGSCHSVLSFWSIIVV